MTLATLTLTRQAQTAVAPKTDPKAAAKPVAALAAFLKADSGLSIKAADKPDAARTAATSLEDAQKERRSSLKAQAKAQVMALLDRIRTLKQFASDNPQVMAKQLAAIVKELKSALKAYADAGGTPRGMDASASAPAAPSQTAESPDETPEKAAAADPSVATDKASADDGPDVAAAAGDIDEKTVATPKPADLDPRNVYEKMRDSVSGSEAAGDMDFVKLVRGVGKVIRDLLNKAKIQTALKGPDDETKKAFKETEEGLKDLDRALEKMDREIRSSSPAAGMFVALYA
jgi:hypothetical protein